MLFCNLLLLGSVLSLGAAAAEQCSKDACYSRVSNLGRPACRSVYHKTVVDCSTVTSTSTVVVTTTVGQNPGGSAVTVTATTTAAAKAKRDDGSLAGVDALEKRANSVCHQTTIPLETTVPASITAQCTDFAEYSSACSCRRVGLRTVTSRSTATVTTETTSTSTVTTTAPGTQTTTTTVTVTVRPTHSPSPYPVYCSNPGNAHPGVGRVNAGMQWALYPYPAGNQPFPDSVETVADLVAVLQQSPPAGRGVIPTVPGFAYYQQEDLIQVYPNAPEQYVGLLQLDHAGFLYAATTGTYTFSITANDNVVAIWTGATALSGWNAGNTFISAVLYGSTQQPPTTGTVYLEKGSYLPIRIAYGNDGVYAVFGVTITNPEGKVLLGPGGTTDVVTAICKPNSPVITA